MENASEIQLIDRVLVIAQRMKQELDTLRKSVEYQRIINIIRSVGNRDYLTEDIDVFGQGLGEPIDPEEFEGDDEEWEELVRDVEDEDF